MEQLALGELIDLLERCPDKATVRFDFCCFAPAHLISYRGFYERLCIVPNREASPTVAEVRAMLLKAIGSVFEGYKGGKYTMHTDTLLYIDNYGDCSDTVPVGVEQELLHDKDGTPGGYVYILTRRIAHH